MTHDAYTTHGSLLPASKLTAVVKHDTKPNKANGI
jgi:hypothetical protein